MQARNTTTSCIPRKGIDDAARCIYDAYMQSTDETPEVHRDWRTILREQGRNMSWLAAQTGKTYPQVASYAYGTAKVPAEWLEQVYALLGEPVR